MYIIYHLFPINKPNEGQIDIELDKVDKAKSGTTIKSYLNYHILRIINDGKFKNPDFDIDKLIKCSVKHIL